MRWILKWRWLLAAAWIICTAVLMFFAPGMADLVREKGDLTVPDGYSSAQAEKLLKDMDQGGESAAVMVFHSKKKLTDQELDEIKQTAEKLKRDKSELAITEILTPFEDSSLEEQMISKDGKTVLLSLSMDLKDRNLKKLMENLYKETESVKTEHYFTGDWLISEDLNTNSQEGLKKTEGITVVFILVVLLLVFRSVITPLIPLVTVGFSYLASQSVVAFLVDRVDFPVSSYTQIFLVAVLFGIGTDYCILLMSRYKEELNRQETLSEAIIQTYRTGGKTVLYSGVAVMIGFAAIGFSTFKLYQSAAAVAIGVAFLLLALYTIVPFFMIVLGMKLFWPAKGSVEHKENKFWGALGSFALKRPLFALLLVAVICIPFLVTYDGQLSYNALEEAGDNARSIKGFNLIADSFGEGQTMPGQVVIENDERMDSEEYIGLAEKISESIHKVNGVETVRSVTRPTGSRIDELFVPEQAKTLKKGVKEGGEGIQQISGGLKEAGEQISGSEPQLEDAVNGIGSLISGTDELKGGVGQVQTGLSRIEKGIRAGSMGAGDIKAGLQEVKTNLKKLASGTDQLYKGYEEASGGLGKLQSQYEGIEKNLGDLSSALQSLDPAFGGVERAYPGITGDTSYQAIKQTVQQASGGLAPLASGMKQLNGGLDTVQSGLKQADQQLKKISSGQKELASGLDALISGVDKLQNGLTSAADGQNQVINNLSKLEGGFDQLNSGQVELKKGFSGLNSQIGELSKGLSKSSEGLDQVHEGLKSAEDYLGGLAETDQSIAGVHIPKEMLESGEFDQVMDMYMPGSRKVMTFDVLFKDNPYSNHAIDQIDDVKAAVKQAVTDTKLEKADMAVGGITSTYHDLGALSDKDFSRTVILMLCGIGIILFFMLRSLVMPIYLILSLILTYYTAESMTELLYVNILGYDGIGWAVPFFAFVILIALGIDYSIFLMDRFGEYKKLPVKEAMLTAMKKMGTVIISAAVILGGTFAAMMPAGVLSLLQIATVVLIGLVLYALVILPLFIPVMARLFGKLNWWPFKNE